VSIRRQTASVLSVGLCVALLSTGCRGETEASVPDPLIPDFQLPNLAGEKVGPSSLPDKVLLLEFWATWCTPCRAQARILDRLYADLASEDVEFIAVSVGEPAETVQRYVDKSPFPYPVLLDSQDQLALIKRMMKGMGLDEERYPPRQAQWFIAANKEEGKRADKVEPDDDFSRRMAEFYAEYDRQCQREGASPLRPTNWRAAARRMKVGSCSDWRK